MLEAEAMPPSMSLGLLEKLLGSTPQFSKESCLEKASVTSVSNVQCKTYNEFERLSPVRLFTWVGESPADEVHLENGNLQLATWVASDT